MFKWLIHPALAFLILFSVLWLLSRLLSRLAFRPKKVPQDAGESYACGESNYDHAVQPDYSTFFPFAFFFTLAHVATLIIATVPFETVSIFIIALVYILGAIVGLYILLKK